MNMSISGTISYTFNGDNIDVKKIHQNLNVLDSTYIEKVHVNLHVHFGNPGTLGNDVRTLWEAIKHLFGL